MLKRKARKLDEPRFITSETCLPLRTQSQNPIWKQQTPKIGGMQLGQGRKPRREKKRLYWQLKEKTKRTKGLVKAIRKQNRFNICTILISVSIGFDI
mmetsp:Transcript_5837/g.6723  ORF Transcript_5837/g.6723 Transcript_5837/m.6723 type:complete len:97 (-) Transcript_5837:31-321(-)